MHEIYNILNLIKGKNRIMEAKQTNTKSTFFKFEKNAENKRSSVVIKSSNIQTRNNSFFPTNSSYISNNQRILKDCPNMKDTFNTSTASRNNNVRGKLIEKISSTLASMIKSKYSDYLKKIQEIVPENTVQNIYNSFQISKSQCNLHYDDNKNQINIKSASQFDNNKKMEIIKKIRINQYINPKVKHLTGFNNI